MAPRWSSSSSPPAPKPRCSPSASSRSPTTEARLHQRAVKVRVGATRVALARPVGAQEVACGNLRRAGQGRIQGLDELPSYRLRTAVEEAADLITAEVEVEHAAGLVRLA